MHALDTSSSVSRPSSRLSRASSRADEHPTVKRKPSAARLSLASTSGAPARPTSTRITATVAARTTVSSRRSSGGINTASATRKQPSPQPTPLHHPHHPPQPASRRHRPLPLQPKDGNIPPPASLAVASRSPVLSTAHRAMRLTASSSSSATKTPAAAAAAAATATTTTTTATASTARQSQMPALTRPGARAPLTPKIAGGRPPSTMASSTSSSSSTAAAALATATTPQQQQQQQQHTQRPRPQAVTPLARRPTRSDSIATNAAETPKDDLAASAPALLQHTNITPRSGTRQHRVESTSSTPTGTPQPESIESWDAAPSPVLGPPLSADFDAAPARRPMVSFGSAPSDLAKVAAAPPLAAPADSKFFYASSARPRSVVGSAPKLFQAPQQPQPQPQQQQGQQKAATFYYANGASVPSKPGAPSATAPALGPPISTANDAFSNKFVYANGVPDVLPSPRSAFAGSRPGSSMSATSKMGQGRAATATGPAPAPYGSSRPVSPLKQPFHPAPRPGVGASTLASKRITPPAGSLPFAAPVGQPLPKSRRTSSEYPLHSAGGTGGPTHKRNKSSATSNENAAVTFARMAPSPRMIASRPPSLEVASPTGLGFPAGFTGLLQAAEELSEEEEGEEGDEGSEGEEFDNDDDVDDGSDDNASNASDDSSGKGKSPVDDLVNNARRERKVQDLQITNASLEAINRTLERQLRKQTAELRRYKRLSRSGRLSLAPLNGGAASDATMEGPLRDPSAMGLEDLSEEDVSGAMGEGAELPEEEEEEMSDSGDEDGSGSSQLSPEAEAGRDAKHRKRDEKRLLMDLSKHQQLLVDSQKINQSIKRCMSWTEELIKEGRRALEYQVRISEVDVHGNAIRDDDDDDDDDDDEKMPAVVVDFGHGDGGSVAGESTKGMQDRDSGVELPCDGD